MFVLCGCGAYFGCVKVCVCARCVYRLCLSLLNVCAGCVCCVFLWVSDCVCRSWRALNCALCLGCTPKEVEAKLAHCTKFKLPWTTYYPGDVCYLMFVCCQM
jgi:hypothetical protein